MERYSTLKPTTSFIQNIGTNLEVYPHLSISSFSEIIQLCILNNIEIVYCDVDKSIFTLSSNPDFFKAFRGLHQLEEDRDLRKANGIKHSALKGNYKGKQPTYQNHIEPVRTMIDSGKSVSEILSELSISRSTYYKIKKEIDEQIALPFG
ncbi:MULTISPECIES: helix-turn-helix domain-containing protein [unclassified Marinobacterium]|uniref:helix-turn-helix domain-containing protein n=1 Tax=unclassified Marinobacterium TaxID=2644139 RepID=UPI001568EA1C|nr:Helix-turn-helix domain of resolvase [Marinobacterium sp. xm-g-48]NRP82436.1 Helix-turn-helix domain of resolvase [Marinobacterium sp. xm-d-509]